VKGTYNSLFLHVMLLSNRPFLIFIRTSDMFTHAIWWVPSLLLQMWKYSTDCLLKPMMYKLCPGTARRRDKTQLFPNKIYCTCLQ